MSAKILVLGKEQPSVYAFDNTYIKPAINVGFSVKTQWVFKTVYYPKDVNGKLAKTVKTDLQREWLSDNQDTLDNADIILCTDGAYFKTLSKTNKIDTLLGQVVNSVCTKTKVMYLPSIGSYSYNPDKVRGQIQLVMENAYNYLKGTYIDIGSNIIHSEAYPITLSDITAYLDLYKNEPIVYVDIETFSLNLTSAGLGTIAFAKDKHNGFAFPVDLGEYPTETRQLLRNFFIEYKGKIVFHKANFDVMILVYELFMDSDTTNFKGMELGLDVMCRNLEDTLLITYLATNSCAGNTLGLKQLAAPFAGNWAVDVNDIKAVDLDKLLKYNLIDTLSTAYTYGTYYPKMVEDNQLELYEGLFKETLRTNIHMQLVGLPINLDEVNSLEKTLEGLAKNALDRIKNSSIINQVEYALTVKHMNKRNDMLKTKQITLTDEWQTFSVTSPKHLQTMLYECMALPIIETTDAGKPSTSKKTVKKLMAHTNDPDYLTVLQAIQDFADINKILTAFIPAFKNADIDKNGNAYLRGYFNLCGTVSGRLSSNNPNLQNLPSTGSKYAKMVKHVFQSNDEWLFVGIDFASLEDRISAVYTKDPNKLAVYLYGYDGHCLRAYSYYGDQMPKITEQLQGLISNSPEYVSIINSIDGHEEYGNFRQRSKNPTFALTYAGTHATLMRNLGFSKKEALRVEQQYHELYKVSDEFIQNKINQAKKNGYVTGAFGLRVRTPLLHNNFGKLSNEAAAEARTAGNALGQGWGLLNDRAMNAVLKRVRESKFNGMVQPCAKIHDACYYLIKNDAELLEWFNKVVVEESLWQDHPNIAHPDVGLGGQLDIFIPTWADALTLPVDATKETIISIVRKHLNMEEV